MIAVYRSTILSLLLACVFPYSVHASSWDLEYWQYFTTTNWEQGPFSLYTQAEVRDHNDLHKLYYYQFTEGFAYQTCPWLDLEVHYTFVYDIPIGDTKFSYIHRLELEINPSLEFSNGLTIIMRNRYEMDKIYHVARLGNLTRHRTMASYPLYNRDPLTAISCYDEIFFDWNFGKFVQNRFCPLMLSFELSSKRSIDCFVFVRNFSKASTGHWYRSIVLGSDLNF